MTICALVVTYNRPELLLECLNCIKNQSHDVDGIIIIDNHSSVETLIIMKQNNYITQYNQFFLKHGGELKTSVNLSSGKVVDVYYHRLSMNSGGAGGFHFGMKRAIELDFEWVWTMDDDGKPTNTCLEKLYYYRNQYDLISPVVYDVNDNNTFSFDCFDPKLEKNIVSRKDLDLYSGNEVLGLSNPFNGILLSNKLIKHVGLPIKEYFIWGDETEYVMRIKRFNYSIALIKNAEYLHPRCKQKIVSFGLFSIIKAPDIKLYCLFRNQYITTRKYEGKRRANFWAIKLIIKYFIYFHWKEFSIVFKALKDGFFEIYGKEAQYLKK